MLKQVNTEKRWSFAFGANLSSINLSRNYRENPYKLGLDVRGYYELNNVLRVMGEFIHTPKFDLNPTWSGVHNNLFNVSLNTMMHIVDQDIIVYTISGLSIQRWRGYYTGILDFSSAKFFYRPNTEVINSTPGLDLGLGFERPFPGFYLYGDFRYRFARLDQAFGITDAAYNLGLKFPLYPDHKNKKNSKLKRKAKHNRKSDKYHWF